jgi:DNA replication protein DnaC
MIFWRAPPKPAGHLTRFWSNWRRQKSPNAPAAAWNAGCASPASSASNPWPISNGTGPPNLVLIGRNGLGKTMIAQNICHAAVLAGYSVLFRSAAALLEEMHRQTPEGRRYKLSKYANTGLLCIDEVGYLSFDDKAADLLYEVVNRRYERKPIILTTNRPFKEWNEVFPNATCIVTLLDRLLHHADVTVIEGDSYRVRESEKETAARRRKK